MRRRIENATLADLERDEYIVGNCICGHRGHVTQSQLHRKLKAQFPVVAIKERMRCTRCLRRPPMDMWVAKLR